MAGVKGRSGTAGGHNRKTQEEHLRAGTFKPGRHGHLPRQTAQAPPGRPNDPGLEGEALAEWGRLVEALETMGTLSPVDGPALHLQATMTADVVAMLQERRDLLRAVAEAKAACRGVAPAQRVRLMELVVEGRLEATRLMLAIARAKAQLHKQLEGLGLTPATRTRVAPARKKDDDQDTAEKLGPLAKLLRRVK